jgi:hypothetical protein
MLLHPQPTDPEKLGAQLLEVDINFAGNGMSKVTSKWYHGNVDADVFVWVDHRENIIKQQINISGDVVEWNILDGLRSGVVIEQEIKAAQLSEAVLFDQTLNDFSVKMAIRLINRVPNIDSPTKEIIIANLSGHHSLNSLTPEEILFRYGELPRGFKVSRWQKLKVFVRRLLS